MLKKETYLEIVHLIIHYIPLALSATKYIGNLYRLVLETTKSIFLSSLHRESWKTIYNYKSTEFKEVFKLDMICVHEFDL